MKDVSKNARHNERKATILFLLSKARLVRKYLYIDDIAKKIGITNNNVARQMSKLKRQGYIHRRKQRFGRHKGEYEYCFLKERGRRVSQELWIRIKLREIDSRVSLNHKKHIPHDLIKLKKHFELEYNKWLQQPEQW